MVDVVQDPGVGSGRSSDTDSRGSSRAIDVVQNPGGAPETAHDPSPLDGAEIGRSTANRFFALEGDTLGREARADGYSSRVLQGLGGDPYSDGSAYIPPAATIQGVLATDGHEDRYDDATMMEYQREDYARRMAYLNAEDFVHANIENALNTLALEERQQALAALKLQFNGAGDLPENIETIFSAEQEKIASMSPEELAAYRTDQEALRQKIASELDAVIDTPEVYDFLAERYTISPPSVAPDDPSFDPTAERRRTIEELSQQILESGFTQMDGKPTLRENASDYVSAQLEGVVQRAEELHSLITHGNEVTRSMSEQERAAYIDKHILPAIEARFKGLTMAEAYQVRHTYNHVAHAKPLDVYGMPTQQFGMEAEGDLMTDVIQLISPDERLRTTRQGDQSDYARLLIGGFNAESYALFLDDRLDGVTNSKAVGNLEELAKKTLNAVGIESIDRQDSIIEALDGLSKEQLLAVEHAYNKSYIPESTNFALGLGERIYRTLRERLNGELDDAHRAQLNQLYENASDTTTSVLPNVLLEKAALREDPFTHTARVQEVAYQVERLKDLFSTEDMSYEEIASAEKVDELVKYEPERREKAKLAVEFLSNLEEHDRHHVIEQLGGRETLLRVADRVVGEKYSSDLLIMSMGIDNPTNYLDNLRAALTPSPSETPDQREARAKELHKLLFEDVNAEYWEDADRDETHDRDERAFREILEDLLQRKYGAEFDRVDLVAAYQAAGTHQRDGVKTTGNYFLDYLAVYPELDAEDPNGEAVELISEIYGRSEERPGILDHLESLHEQLNTRLTEAQDALKAEFEERIASTPPPQHAALQQEFANRAQELDVNGAEYSKILDAEASAFTASGELAWTQQQVRAAYLAAEYPQKD